MSHQYKQEARLLRSTAIVLIFALLIFLLVNHWSEIKIVLGVIG